MNEKLYPVMMTGERIAKNANIMPGHLAAAYQEALDENGLDEDGDEMPLTCNGRPVELVNDGDMLCGLAYVIGGGLVRYDDAFQATDAERRRLLRELGVEVKR